MPPYVLSLLASGALLSSSLTGTAAAAVDPTGLTCGASWLTHPTEGWHLAELDAGPLALTDPADPSAVHWGSVTCTVQAEEPHGTAANDLASVTGSTTPGAAAVAGTVAFRHDPARWAYLCTRVDLFDGPTLYYDELYGAWSTSETASCGAWDIGVTGQIVGDLIRPVAELIGEMDMVCPVLRTLLPPEGDVPGVWDCPPYDT